MKDKFGKKKKGNNLETLSLAIDYFKTKNIKIVKYFFDANPNSVDKKMLNREDYKKCSICNNKLYKMSEGSKHGIVDKVKIRLKRHMVFLDNCGNQHYTCYSLKRCLNDKECLDGNGEVDLEYHPPNCSEFFEEYVDLNELDTHFVDSLVIKYNQYVKPFLKKWHNENVSKANVLEFINNLRVIENKYIDLYLRSPEDKKFFREKIHRILGVENG